MKRPIAHASSVLKSWPSVILVAILPFVFLGLIGMPKGAKDEIQIQALIKKVKGLNGQKKHQESIELLSSALESQQDPNIRSLLLQTFDLFLEEQIRQGEQEIHFDRKDIRAYLRVAGSLELMDRKDKAMELLVDGICENPDAAELWMEIAKLELKAGRDMEAFDVFREIAKNDAKNARASNNAAYILARHQKSTEYDLREAEKLAEKARKLEPKNPEYIDTLAEVFFRTGEIQKARKLIKEAIRLAPEKHIFRSQLKRFSEAN
jgi:Flp pilus assembly protein TadD